MNVESAKFIRGDQEAIREVGKGVKRRLLGYGDHILMAKVEFEKDSIGPIHTHYHSQATYVESGEFEVEINGKLELLKAGDAFYIPPHEPHGAKCISAGVLIDVFSPAREDFLKEEDTMYES